MAEHANYDDKSTQTEPENAPIPWEVFYMSIAELESQRSNCVDAERVNLINNRINYRHNLVSKIAQ